MSSVAVSKTSKPEIVGIFFDVKISESHELTATPTLYPIEGTSEDVVEHVILNPRIVTVECYMSNVDDDNKARAQNAIAALEELDALRVAREPMDLTTEHLIYNNMLVTNIKADHPGSGPTDTGSLAFTITFQQVVLLNTKSIVTAAKTLNSKSGTSKGDAVDKSATTEIDAGIK